MRIWIAYCNSEFVPVYYKLLLTQEKDKQRPLREALIKALNYIEEGFKKFSQGDYFFGNQISLVDIAFYPFFERFVTNVYYRDTPIPEHCEHLRRWIRIMRERPAVKETANPPEFYLERYKRFAEGDISGRSGYKKILDDLWK